MFTTLVLLVMPRAPAKKSAAPARRRAPARSSAPRRYGVRGRGGYWDNVKSRWATGGKYANAFKAGGAALGSGLGGAPGGAIGGALGGLLNRALYSLTGFGDYKIQRNSLLEETNGPPTVQNRGKEFVVRHREYIQDMYSASGAASSVSAFAIQGYPINPGQATTFPWLSSISLMFEQYRLDGMVFEYKSMYSDAVVTQNGSIGSVILATEYNAGAPAFPTKQAMENYEFAQSCKPSCSVLHPIECARSQSVLSEMYVRPGTVPVGEDVKTYDFGDFYFASQGIPLGAAGAAVNLGELWISYQISFMKPKIQTRSNLYVDSGFAAFSTKTGSAPLTIACGLNNTYKLSTSNIDVNLTADNVFTFVLGSSPMKYQINFQWKAFNDTYNAGLVWRAPALAFTNCSSVNAASSGVYINELIPRNGASNAAGSGCSIQYFISLPAATPSAPTSSITIGADWAVDAAASVRFDGYINAVPLVLNQE